jgi:hypothetical protein
MMMSIKPYKRTAIGLVAFVWLFSAVLFIVTAQQPSNNNSRSVEQKADSTDVLYSDSQGEYIVEEVPTENPWLWKSNPLVVHFYW